MVTTRKRALACDIPASPKKRMMSKEEEEDPPHCRDEGAGAGAGNGAGEEGYEKIREERIRENMERMKQLGIIDLSIHLNKSRHLLLSPRPRTPPDLTTFNFPTKRPPSRRSSRLQNATPVSYAEITLKEDSVANRQHLVVEGQKEEIYTDEHEKLLGTCETSWVLFVDGYGCHGKRIYDQVKGKTCHQCRQKTLGHRTQCSKCNLVQGQFCGDCLYMRYGENVLEVKKNPKWTCPVCRGICNCSLCRIKKGWTPTGSLYKKALNLGFKSVAHYLIQTRREQTNSKDENAAARTSSKKSLRFTDSEDPSNPKSPLESDVGLGLVPCDNKRNIEWSGKKDGSQSLYEDTEEVSNVLVDKEDPQGGEEKAIETSPDSITSRGMKRNDKMEKGWEAAESANTSLDLIASRLRKRCRNKE